MLEDIFPPYYTPYRGSEIKYFTKKCENEI